MKMGKQKDFDKDQIGMASWLWKEEQPVKQLPKTYLMQVRNYCSLNYW